MSEAAASSDDRRSHLLLLLVLLLTAAVALGWSHLRPLDQDEAFVFQTDSVSTLRQLIGVQLHTPISLDPPVYHLLGHAAIRAFGASAFAVRLPSLLGFLLMQGCLYGIATRLAGALAGVIAAALPAITATLFYAQQARPYGLLLGLGALLLLAWQHGTRDADRSAWLITLAVTLALALNTHYFAILLLVPLYAAELTRIVILRRMDLPVLAAIVAGSAGELLTLPFQHAAGEFRKHYYNAGEVGLHAITQSYRALFINYTTYPMLVQHVMMVLLVIAACALALVLVRRLRARNPAVPLHELVFLLALSVLPFFGYLLARFVTHSIEVRYILPAMIGLSVLIAIALLPVLRSRASGILLSATFVMLVLSGVPRLRGAATQTAARADSLTAPGAPLNGAPIFLQNMGNFDELAAYVPDPALRSRFALVYSAPLEIDLAHHDTQSLTAEHMTHFTGFRIARYEDLRSEPGPHLFVLYHGGGWNWLDRQLFIDHAVITALGPALGGDLVSVVFPR